MSIGIIIKGPEGLVLAAESRITLGGTSNGRQFPVFFDNAKKVLGFPEPHDYIGAVTYGLGSIGLRTASSYIPEFEESLPKKRITVLKFTNLLKDFFLEQWQEYSSTLTEEYDGPPMAFIVGGFNKGEPYGRLYLLYIPSEPEPIEQHTPPNNFGTVWGGQRGIVDRLIQGYDERALDIIKTELNLDDCQINGIKEKLLELQMAMPTQFLALQDCIDLALLFIRTTIEAQRLTVALRGCGGPIDVATITRLQGFKFIQEKKLKGEPLYTPME